MHQRSVSTALLHYTKWLCFFHLQRRIKHFCPPLKFSFVVMPEAALIAGHIPQYCLPYWSLLSLVLTICWFVFYERCEAEIICVQNTAQYDFDLWPALIIKLINNNMEFPEHSFFVEYCPQEELAYNFPSVERRLSLNWCTDSIPLFFLTTYFHETCWKITYKRTFHLCQFELQLARGSEWWSWELGNTRTMTYVLPSDPLS